MSIVCPKCTSQVCKKNGYTRHGKQNFRCLLCGRQFSLDPDEVNRLEYESVVQEEIVQYQDSTD